MSRRPPRRSASSPRRRSRGRGGAARPRRQRTPPARRREDHLRHLVDVLEPGGFGGSRSARGPRPLRRAPRGEAAAAAPKNSRARAISSPGRARRRVRKAALAIIGWSAAAGAEQPALAGLDPGAGVEFEEPARALDQVEVGAPRRGLSQAGRRRPRYRPVRVVGDLPGVAVGVDEDAAVAAPEGLGRLAGDRRARRRGPPRSPRRPPPASRS